MTDGKSTAIRSSIVSNQSAENEVRDRFARLFQPIFLIGEDPGGDHFVEDAEDGLRDELGMERSAEDASLLSMLDDGPQNLEVLADFLLRELAHELQAVAQLDLENDRDRAIASHRRQIRTDRASKPLLRVGDARELVPEQIQMFSRVLAEDRDEQMLLVLEVQIDRSVSDTRFFRDFGDLRVEVAGARKDIRRRTKNPFVPTRNLFRLRAAASRTRR